jgi:chaperonin GroES
VGVKLKMSKDNVMIQVRKREEVTKGGIVLPDAKELKDDPVGVVVGVGPDVTDIEEGDTVHFGTYAGQELTLEDQDYIILKYDDILAKEYEEN